MSVDEILLKSRFQPLERILAYDVFNTGFNGWMTLMPNFTEYPDFDVPATLVCKDQWPPVMLSSATYRYPGTHGAMSGTYSLKLSTRPVAAPYVENLQKAHLATPSRGSRSTGRKTGSSRSSAGSPIRQNRTWWTVVTALSLDSMRTPSEISEWDSTYRNTGNAIS